MARLFEVHLPIGLSSVKLDSQGRATVQYTVKNVSARPIDGRAVLISLPQLKPPRGAVEQGWVRIDGKTDRHFGVDKEETFTVRVAVPPKSPAGDYTFRLDTVWVEQTDQGDPGGAIRFAVAAPQPPHFPLWLIPVLLLVVAGLGVGGWLILRPHGLTVPNLKGQTVSEADAALKLVGLALDSNAQSVESKPENSGKIVTQNPDAGQKATKGQAVQVTVGAEMVAVPLLVGHPFQEAQGMLAEKGLAVGQSTPVENPNFTGGVVTSQSPPAQQPVKTGTAIDVQVTPQTVPVTSVAGQTLGNAIIILRQIGLKVAPEFDGDTTKTVINQTPAANSPAPVGSSVKLFFPASAACLTRICEYRGGIAKQMILEQGMIAQKALSPGPSPNK